MGGGAHLGKGQEGRGALWGDQEGGGAEGAEVWVRVQLPFGGEGFGRGT